MGWLVSLLDNTLLHQCLWGDAAHAPSHVSVQVRHTRSSMALLTDVVLRVEIAEHQIRLPGYAPVKRSWSAAESAFTVRDREIKDQEVVKGFQTAVRDLSFLVREHDPRIGTMLEEGQSKDFLPKMPLFDPTRIRPPAWNRGSGIDATPCPLCSDGFGQGYPAMWGGGNLQWVHPACWVRAHE